jgi:hypothetical protein
VRAGNVGALLNPPKKAAGARFATDVLVDRPLEEAAREIAMTWPRSHDGTAR